MIQALKGRRGATLRYSVRLALMSALLLASGCRGAVDPAKERFLRDYITETAPGLTAPRREEALAAFLGAEARFGVDALLLAAIAEQESHFRPRVRGRRGSLGIMQVKPETARAVAARHRIVYKDARQLYEPRVCIPIAAAYLVELERDFGSRKIALTAYNRGPTEVRRLLRRGGSGSSRYATRVLHRYQLLSERFRRGAGQAT